MVTDIDKYAEASNLEIFLFVNIENPREKLKILNYISKSNYKIATLISLRAYIVATAKIDVGCIISAGVVIERNSKIGNCLNIGYNSIIISNMSIPEFAKIIYNSVINNSVIALNKKHRKD